MSEDKIISERDEVLVLDADGVQVQGKSRYVLAFKEAFMNQPNETSKKFWLTFDCPVWDDMSKGDRVQAHTMLCQFMGNDGKPKKTLKVSKMAKLAEEEYADPTEASPAPHPTKNDALVTALAFAKAWGAVRSGADISVETFCNEVARGAVVLPALVALGGEAVEDDDSIPF